MGPRTGVGNIEMVSAFLRWKFGIRFVMNPVPKDGGLAFEFTAFVTGFDLLS